MSDQTDKICPCGSTRWMEIAGDYNHEHESSHIPSKYDIGDGKTIWFSVCLDCHMQGNWPDKQTIALSSNTRDDNVTPEVHHYSLPIRAKTALQQVTMHDKETHLYIDQQQGLLIVFTEDDNPSVLGFILAMKYHNLPQPLKVVEYDREKHLYIDLMDKLLLFAKQGNRPVVVGYLLNGVITPVTDELREIAINRDFAICDTHFNEQLTDALKEIASNLDTPKIDFVKQLNHI